MNRHHKFYAALTVKKAELIEGQFIMGGSLSKTAMCLEFLVKELGADVVKELVPSDLIMDAIIEKERTEARVLPDWSPGTSSFQARQLLNEIMMAFHPTPLEVWRGGFVLKLGENALMPDLFVTLGRDRLYDYFYDGAPLLVIERYLPAYENLNASSRIQCYAKAGLKNLWILSADAPTIVSYVLRDGVFVPSSLPELEVAQVPQFIDTLPKTSAVYHRRQDLENIRYGSIPFAPQIALHPQQLDFTSFISWGGELKLEYIQKPVWGGNEQSTKEYLGLLLRSLGLVEAVRYLPNEDWY